MIQRIVSTLLYLSNPSLDSRLSDIERRLANIEKELKRQIRFAFWAFTAAGGVALVSIGVSLHGQLPSTATRYIYIGGGLIGIAGLLAVVEIPRGILRKNSDE